MEPAPPSGPAPVAGGRPTAGRSFRKRSSTTSQRILQAKLLDWRLNAEETSGDRNSRRFLLPRTADPLRRLEDAAQHKDGSKDITEWPYPEAGLETLLETCAGLLDDLSRLVKRVLAAGGPCPTGIDDRVVMDEEHVPSRFEGTGWDDSFADGASLDNQSPEPMVDMPSFIQSCTAVSNMMWFKDAEAYKQLGLKPPAEKDDFEHSLDGGPVWQVLVPGCLADGEGEGPRRKRLTQEQQEAAREKLATTLAWRHTPGDDGEEDHDAAARERTVAYQAFCKGFIESGQLARDELKAFAAQEGKPVTPRRYAPTLCEDEAKADEPKKVISEDRRRRNAKKRKVLDSFWEANAQNETELAELVARTGEEPLPKRVAREASPEWIAVLTAPSKAQLLAEAMAASPNTIYRRAEASRRPGREMQLVLPFATKLADLRTPLCRHSGAAPGSYNAVEWSVGKWLRLPRKRVDSSRGAAARFAARFAAEEEPAYLVPASRSYDMSLDWSLYLAIARYLPALSHSARMIFAATVDSWEALQDEMLKKASGATAGASNAAECATAGQTSAASEEAATAASSLQPFFGVRLGDLRNLIAEHQAWFNEERWCKFSNKNKKKTMYDVCPELIIPATTTRERIVTLMDEDMEKLRSRFDDPPGIFYSSSDLTIDPGLGTVTLGGVEVPAGLTVHGKLKHGGRVRVGYWKLRDARDQMWKTVEVHGREQASLADVAPVPEELPGDPSESVGEESDRVWAAGDLAVGDTIVLRAGVSYIEMLAQGGDLHPLHSFASHFWGEETVDFLQTLNKHAETLQDQGGVEAHDRVYYVCTFNNNQHRVELGSSWKTSPFNRALEYVSSMAKAEPTQPRDAVMVFDSTAAPLLRKWCIFEAWRCTELDLPLKLFAPEGEITRNSTSTTSNDVLRMVSEVDVRSAGCSVKSDAVMIDRAIEDSPGGFNAVHAKLRTRVLDLMTFIGSLAVSVDPVTGKRVEEVELQVRGVAPAAVEGTHMLTREIARDMCSDDGALGRNILLVAPAGAGKSVFSRALVRHAVAVSNAGGQEVLPIRVPLAELAKVVKRIRSTTASELKLLSAQLRMHAITHEVYRSRKRVLDNPDFSSIFDMWAARAFLRDSGAVTSEKPGRQRLLILDGFDEAGDSRAQIVAWLRSYLQAFPGIRTLLTSRPSGLNAVGMSTGHVRAPQRASVLHVNQEKNQAALSVDFPLGSVLTVSGLGTASSCFLVASEELQLTLAEVRPNTLRVCAEGRTGGLDDPLERALCLVPGTVEVELLPDSFKPEDVQGAWPGARARLTIHEEAAILAKKEQSEHKVAMTVHDVITVEIIALGAGVRYDLQRRIETSGNARGTVTFGAVKISRDHLKQLSLDDVQASLDALNEQRKLAQEGQDRDDLNRKIAHLELSRARLERCRGHPILDIRLDVLEATRYVTFHEAGLAVDGPREAVSLASLEIGAQVRDVLVRKQLQQETGFSEFEVDVIDDSAACGIIRNLGGAALSDFDPPMLGNFASNLWDRPLMANLLAQYLEMAGLSRALDLSPAVAELEIFQFISERLILQAAQVVAPNGKEDVVRKKFDHIQASLQELSRQKMNRNERLWTKENLRKLFEEAIRGHLRLFEPQRNGKAVQLYHYRIQELLAGQAWIRAGHSIESASRRMVQKEALVQTGLAPLRFLVQNQLLSQVDSEDLCLDFVGFGRYEDAIATMMHQYLPPTLRGLTLKMPRLKSACVPASDVAKALRTGIARLALDFHACKISDAGLAELGLAQLSKLEALELDLSLCSKVTTDGLEKVAAQLKDSISKLHVSASHALGGSDLRPFVQQLPQSLQILHLDISAWKSVGDKGVSGIGAALPRGLQDFSLTVRKCNRLTSAGLVQLCDSLPETLVRLTIDFRLSLGIGGKTQAEQSLKELSSKLPETLEDFSLVCNRYVADEELLGISSTLPRALRNLSLDFRRVAGLTDMGISGLGGNLPPGLQSLRLSCALCMKVTDSGIGAVVNNLPETLQELRLNFAACSRIGDETLANLGDRLPAGLRTLVVNTSSCKRVGDRGISGLCAHLPAGLAAIDLEFAGCEDITDDGLAAVGASLPPSLQKFHLKCQRVAQIGDDGLIALSAKLPVGLQDVVLNFSRSQLGDRGLAALAESCPGLQSAATLCLDISHCQRASNEGLLAVAAKLPKTDSSAAAPASNENQQSLQIHAYDCPKVTSDGLTGFRDKVTHQPQMLRVNFDKKFLKGSRWIRPTADCC